MQLLLGLNIINVHMMKKQKNVLVKIKNAQNLKILITIIIATPMVFLQKIKKIRNAFLKIRNASKNIFIVLLIQETIKLNVNQ